MEREANYAAVGAFVVFVAALAVLFVYWYSDSRDRRDYQRYEIYFEGSVSGLERGAAVRYLGVDVGRVYEMRIDPREASRVQVLADIDSSAPISQRTIAELSLQGVTGLLYIDLLDNTGARALASLVPSQKYPVIRAARSRFDAFLTSLPDVLAVVHSVADRATKILSDKNIAAISSSLSNIDKATTQLPATLTEVQALVTDLRSTAAELNTAATSARGVIDVAGPELVGAVQRMNTVADNLSTVTLQLSQLVGDTRTDLRAFTQDGLQEFERLLRDGRSATREVRDLSRSLRENPSQLLYQPPEQGVEIPP